MNIHVYTTLIKNLLRIHNSAQFEISLHFQHAITLCLNNFWLND